MARALPSDALKHYNTVIDYLKDVSKLKHELSAGTDPKKIKKIEKNQQLPKFSCPLLFKNSRVCVVSSH